MYLAPRRGKIGSKLALVEAEDLPFLIIKILIGRYNFKGHAFSGYTFNFRKYSIWMALIFPARFVAGNLLKPC